MKSNIDMKNTTLCYIEDDNSYLMMHRTKKINDLNHDKWVGLGGKFEENETPFECARREIMEEAGIYPHKLKYRGIVTFVSDKYGTEYMHLFTSKGYRGKINDYCMEGELCWVKKDKIKDLPLWEGDKIFFDLLDKEKKFFSLKLVYEGDNLVYHQVEF